MKKYKSLVYSLIIFAIIIIIILCLFFSKVPFLKTTIDNFYCKGINKESTLENIENINSNLNNYRVIKKSAQSLEDVSAAFYYDKNNRLILSDIDDSNYNIFGSIKYYFYNGNLFFIDRIEGEYDENAIWGNDGLYRSDAKLVKKNWFEEQFIIYDKSLCQFISVRPRFESNVFGKSDPNTDVKNLIERYYTYFQKIQTKNN